jgi:ADP-ribose pyrophosphatase
MKILPWVELSRETIFQKYGHKLDKVVFRMPSGIESDYYLSGNHANIVCVFGLTADKKVILVEQFRPGPQKILYELPGGAVDHNETPLEAAKREFLEESGYTGDFEQITSSVVDAYSNATRFHFIATNCQKVADPKNTDTEFTQVILMEMSKFKDHLLSGQLSDIATGFYGLNHLERI